MKIKLIAGALLLAISVPAMGQEGTAKKQLTREEKIKLHEDNVRAIIEARRQAKIAEDQQPTSRTLALSNLRLTLHFEEARCEVIFNALGEKAGITYTLTPGLQSRRISVHYADVSFAQIEADLCKQLGSIVIASEDGASRQIGPVEDLLALPPLKEATTDEECVDYSSMTKEERIAEHEARVKDIIRKTRAQKVAEAATAGTAPPGEGGINLNFQGAKFATVLTVTGNQARTTYIASPALQHKQVQIDVDGASAAEVEAMFCSQLQCQVVKVFDGAINIFARSEELERIASLEKSVASAGLPPDRKASLVFQSAKLESILPVLENQTGTRIELAPEAAGRQVSILAKDASLVEILFQFCFSCGLDVESTAGGIRLVALGPETSKGL